MVDLNDTRNDDRAKLVPENQGTSENPVAPLLNDNAQRVDFSTNKCNDAWAAILFYLHIFGIIGLAFANFGEIEWEGSDGNSNVEYIVILFLTIWAGLVGAYVYLNILRNNAKCAINTAIILTCALAWVYTIYMFAIGQFLWGALMAVCALGCTFYYFYIQSRIPFTVALIEIGVKVVDQNSGILYAAVMTIFVQAAFIGVWALAFVGYADSTKEEGSDDWKLEPSFLFLFVLSAYWTFETVRYVLYCTACGVTASWFFTPDKPNATQGAFTRATVWSFGSLAFGGLLIAIIKTLEFIVRYTQNNTDNENIACQVLSCMILCLLYCLEDILEFLNEFGFAFVAIYGMTYCAACQSVWELIKSTGFESIFQYDLTGVAIWLGCLGTGLLTFLVTVGYAKLIATDKVNDNGFTIGFVGLCVAFGIAYVVLMIIVAAVTTTFIVWAMDPRTLFMNRPDEAQQLKEATESIPGVALDDRHMNPVLNNGGVGAV